MDIKEEIKRLINKVLVDLNFEPVDFDVEVPKDTSHGDLSSNVAMILARLLKRNPMDIALEIITGFEKHIDFNEISTEKYAGKLIDAYQTSEYIDVLIDRAAPGFINFKINKSYYKKIIEVVLEKKDDFGKSEINKGKTFLVEHTSPNPNKEFHLGHLKNNVTGLSLSYLFEAIGTKVFRDAIDNNRGIAIAKLMWGYLKFGKIEGENTNVEYWFTHKNEWHTPDTLEKAKGKPDRLMDIMYTKGADDFKNNLEVEAAVRQLALDWEDYDSGKLENEKLKATWALWEQTQKWVWTGYERSIGRIGGYKFDKIWHEHEIYKKGREHILRGLELGVFKKTEDGAVVSDLKKDFNLPDTILIKNDGTSLYITQDIELTNLKKKTFNPDEMFWIIGPEQSLAMKQMFAVCSQLGFGKYEDFHHLPYGFVSIKKADGKISKMSSRDGTAIYVDDLIEMAKDEIKTYIKKEISPDEIEAISEKVAIGAIKYGLLKVSRTTDQVFDLKNTVSFEGDSGPYVMYTYARAKSILKNYELRITNYEKQQVLNSEYEMALLKKIYSFEEEIIAAAKNYSPNLIANYVYDLAQKFNAFYTNCQVLNAETPEDKGARLALTAATAQVLKNGLALLGIETIEKM